MITYIGGFDRAC